MKKKFLAGRLALSVSLAVVLAATPVLAAEVEYSPAVTAEAEAEAPAEEETPAEEEAPEEAVPAEEETPEVIAPAEEETPEVIAPAEEETPEESAPVEEEAPAEEKVDGITAVELSDGHQAYVYVPQGDGIDVGHNATWKPIILVYNETTMDAEAVLAQAKDGGFADIAAQEECVIMFINPLEESGWTEADKTSILAAVGSNDYAAAYSDGTLADYDAATGQNPDGKFPGYSEKVYVFADGAAADFVSTYILAGQNDTVHYMDGYYKPSAAYLSNVSAVPAEIQSNNEDVDMPVYLVNAAQSVADFYKNVNENAYTTTASSSAKESFDAANVKAAWNGLVSSVRRCYDVVIDINDYETDYVNVHETMVTTDGTEVEYYLWIPESVAAADEGTVPLVVGMHGNDNSALTMANLTEWPTLAAENGFIYMGLNSVESATDDQIMEAVFAVEEAYATIDTSRVFATGFSNGSRHSWLLAVNEKYSDCFAGIAPMNLLTINLSEDSLYDDSIMPCIYFGSTGSHLKEIPNQPWYLPFMNYDTDVAMKHILSRNKVTDNYVNDTEAGFWGIEADSTEEYTSKYFNVADKQVVDTVSNYVSADGNVYTKLVACTAIHEYEDLNAELAWDFLSQFYRKADGCIGYVDEVVDDYDSEAITPIELTYDNNGETITNNAFVYVPQEDGISVGHNATWKPIIVVYGHYETERDVENDLIAGGYDKIAAEEECVIMFITRSKAAWTENDRYSLIAAVNKYSDSTNYAYDPVTGLSDQGDSGLFYPGYSERVYVFADGAAADFVSEYIVPGTFANIHYADSYFKPASVYLSNVKKAPTAIDTLRDESVDMPVYLVNATKSVINAYKGLNSVASKVVTAADSKKSGFGKNVVTAGWNKLVKNYRRQYDVSIAIADYEAIANETECHFTCDDGTVIEYYTYVPAGLEKAAKGTLPLVVGFHGNGNSALTMAHADEWVEKAVEEGFVYIGVNKHEYLTDAEVMEMLQAYVAANKSINTARIYCTGFSQGSMRTASLTYSADYASFFAAASPQNGLWLEYYSEKEALEENPIIMPTMYVGGVSSHIHEVVNNYTLGFMGTDPADNLPYILARNKAAFTYKNDGTGYWGITNKNATVSTITSNYFSDKQVQVTSIKSKDGYEYTKLVAGIGFMHEYDTTYTDLAWEFMSQYSRAKDGSLIVDGLSNKKAADGNWYVYKAGKVDKTYTGFAQNKNGWFYVVNGKVDFTVTSVVKGTVNGKTGYWYVKKGKVQFETTVAKNDKGWWYVKKGMVDFTYTGLAKNDKGWWYVKKGKVDFTFTGLVKNEKGTWYVKNGKVDFTKTGKVTYKGKTYNVVKGKVK